MKTARIVVPAIALGAGGAAACFARGIETVTLGWKPAGMLTRPRRTGTSQPALRSIADLNDNSSDQESQKRDESVKVVRYGVQTITTTQK